MARTDLPRPTDGELGLLRVLWKHGPCTVRQVLGHLGGPDRVGYTTVLKLLQIMAEKGLVHRDEQQRTHVYYPAVSEEQTQRRLVTHLLDRAFDGSARKLILQALSARKASPQELAQVRRVLDDMERREP